MDQRSRAKPRIYTLSTAALDRVARRILTRNFGPPTLDKQTGNVLERRRAVASKARTHGGRPGLTAADFWSLFELDDGNNSGALLSELLRYKNKPGRLLCELARLKAAPKARAARRRARNALAGRLKTCKSERDLPGIYEWVKKCYPIPRTGDLIAKFLREWGLYSSAPSRAALHRWAAGTDIQELHVEILRIHDRVDRPYRIEPHIGSAHPPVKPAQ